MTKHDLMKVQFLNRELTDKAFKVYSSSRFVFYKKNGRYFVTMNPYSDDLFEIGSISQVNRYLESWSDENL